MRVKSLCLCIVTFGIAQLAQVIYLAHLRAISRME